MKAVFDKVGNCWRIVFGDSLIGIDGTYHWQSIADMVSDLRYKGLTIGHNNTIETI